MMKESSEFCYIFRNGHRQCLSNFIIVMVLLFSSRSYSKNKFWFTGSIQGRGGVHTETPHTLATHRYQLDFKQNARFSKSLSMVAGFQSWAEVAPAVDAEKRPDQYLKEDSSDFSPSDLYLQKSLGSGFLRAGYQQAPWGETFGFFYSDLVNPRDFRDGGFGDIADLRLSVPMVNYKYVSSRVGIQFLYLPQPMFHLLPLPGSDFAPSVDLTQLGLLTTTSLVVEREKEKEFGGGGGEYGIRANYYYSPLEFALFYFRGYDRFPYYELASYDSIQVKLKENHAPMQSFGLSSTIELGGFLVRLEGILFAQRRFPSLSSSYGLTYVESNERVFVSELDLPSFWGIRTSLQWANSLVMNPVQGKALMREVEVQTVSARLQKDLPGDQSVELIYLASVSDRGSRLMGKYVVPLSGKIDSQFSLDLFSGPESSDWGQIKNASRAFVSLKCYLK